MCDSVGHSEITPDKQFALERFLSLHMEITRRVLRRNIQRDHRHRWANPCYHYIDAYAGDGAEWEDCPGSTGVFKEVVARHDMPYQAHFIDREAVNVESLRDRLSKDDIVRSEGQTIEVHEGNCQDVVPEIMATWRRYAYGLIYCDPNGCVETEMVQKAAEDQRRIDILLRISATAIKRHRRARASRQVEIPNLIEEINSICKAHWLVRGPRLGDKWQWIFLFGSNYANYPDWKKHDFVRLDSPSGLSILKQTNYTAEELADIAKSHQLLLDTRERTQNEVVKRSGGLCEKCGDPASQVHHTSYPTVDTAGNLRHVCYSCHCQIHEVAP